MAKGEILRVRKSRRAVGVDTLSGRKQVSITFTRKQFVKINREARRQRVSFAEAVRVAVDQTYG